MKIKILLLLFSLFFILNEHLSALNELTVRVPDIYTSYPGFIDKSTLVIEPHGGYTEQSLYLEYSDHGQFSPGNNVEVIHRFELPQGAVVNDLWLWIGDSVMKAICLDTWTARSIYDSKFECFVLTNIIKIRSLVMIAGSILYHNKSF